MIFVKRETKLKDNIKNVFKVKKKFADSWQPTDTITSIVYSSLATKDWAND